MAAVFRGAYYLDYHRLPFIDAPLFDSVVYLRQRQAVLDGDFGHPTLLAFSPLYGYFLAIVDALVVPAQLTLGVLNVFLFHRVTLRLATGGGGSPVDVPPQARWAAVASSGAFVLYGLAVFYETKVMAETLGLSLLLLGVLSLQRSHHAAHAVAGVLFGLATLCRANLVFTLPLWPVVAWICEPSQRPVARARSAGVLAAGILAVVVANGLWTWHHAGRFVPVILVSQTVDGTSGAAFDGTLKASSGGQGPPSAWDVVRQAEETPAHGDDGPPRLDVAGWLVEAPAKIALTFRDVETGFQYGYYGERTELRSLSLLPLSFMGLVLMSLWGLLRDPGVRRRAISFLPLVLGVLLTTTLYHPSSRYRLPLVVALVPLAGIGFVQLAHDLQVRAERRRECRSTLVNWRSAGAALVLLAVVFLSVRTVTYELRRPGLWELRVAEGEIRRGDVEAANGRIQSAIQRGGDDPAVQRRLSLLLRAYRFQLASEPAPVTEQAHSD